MYYLNLSAKQLVRLIELDRKKYINMSEEQLNEESGQLETPAPTPTTTTTTSMALILKRLSKINLIIYIIIISNSAGLTLISH